MNPLRKLSPFKRRVDSIVDSLYRELRKTTGENGGNTGIEVPILEDDQLTVAVVMRIQEVHPDVKIMKDGRKMTIGLERGFKSALSDDLYNKLHVDEWFLEKGQRPVDD